MNFSFVTGTVLLLGASVAVQALAQQRPQDVQAASQQRGQAEVAAQQTQATQPTAQNPSQQAPVNAQQSSAPAANASSTVLRVNSQLVIVDVVVLNKDGKPVRGLTQNMFHIAEDGAQQTIRHFEEHSSQQPAVNGPALPRLPAGTFTDYTPVAPDSTLNILLVDSLNTPAKDQSYVQTQLKEYIKNAKPGTRVAIFGLANQLVLLQGFTSDPETLKDAINHKLIPHYSSLLDDPGGSGVDPLTASDSATAGADPSTSPGAIINNPVASAAANFQQFEAETAAIQTQMRLQHTLDAFNALAHYLATFPGRKNLIWFSGSFPLNVLPDPSLVNPFAVANTNEDQFRETTNLLAKAQVAVYPVDARGLIAPPMYNASASGRRYGPNPQGFNAAASTFNSSQASEHTTMDVLANSTGGHAFYNTNGLSTAVSEAIDSGSNYYTIVYTPTNRKQDGGFRKITVDDSGAPGSNTQQLTYRQGYYSNDTTQKKPDKLASATVGASTGGPAATAAAFQRAAMSRGAPTPQDILFTVRVLPASTTTEATVAPGNQLKPAVSPKALFRRYNVDYVALPKDVTLTAQPDGRRQGSLQFIVYVFDVDGNLLNTDGRSISYNLNDRDYAKFVQSAIQMHLEVSAPAKVETYLRIGILDSSSNRFGVVEVPTSSVNQLPPPEYGGAPKASTTKPDAAPSAVPPANQTPQ